MIAVPGLQHEPRIGDPVDNHGVAGHQRRHKVMIKCDRKAQ